MEVQRLRWADRRLWIEPRLRLRLHDLGSRCGDTFVPTRACGLKVSGRRHRQVAGQLAIGGWSCRNCSSVDLKLLTERSDGPSGPTAEVDLTFEALPTWQDG